MSLHDYLTILRRRWVSALVVALAVIAASAGITLALPSEYTASTRLFFGVRAGQSPSELAQGSTFTERQMASYEQVATSPLVLDKVVSSLGLSTTTDELASRVSADAAPGTVVLRISVTESSPDEAADLANAVAQQLITTVGSLAPTQASGTDAVRATVLAPATVPPSPSSPHVRRNLALGIAFGILLGIGYALLRNLFDTRIRRGDDVAAITERPVLGSIALDEQLAQHPVFVADQPFGRAAEAVRRLRTNLQLASDEGGSKAVVVTSSIAGEGKSTTIVNLAASLADAGAKVVLVDANLRRPAVAGYVGDEGSTGLSTILTGQAALEDVVRPWRSSTLSVLSSGPVPSNPSELLGSRDMVELLETLEASYDVVLIDTPPLLPVTDATILTALAGGTVLVVGADKLRRDQLRQTLSIIEGGGGRIHGIVLNKVSKRDKQDIGEGYESYSASSGPRRGARSETPAVEGRKVPALSSSSQSE